MSLNRSFVLMMAIALATPAAPPPPATQPDVESLIIQLAADRRPDRQRAQDRLVELGLGSPEVEARLRRLLRETRDEEAASRAQAALRLIAEGKAAGATAITLHLKEASGGDAFAALAKASGVEFGTEPPELWAQKPRGGPGASPIALDAEGQPFWSVFRELCRQARVEPDFGDNGRFKLLESADGKWAATPAVVAGPLLIRAVRITETRALDFADPANPELSRQLELNFYVEPKLRVLAEAFAARIELAVDDKGKSLMPAAPAPGDAAPADEQELTNVADTSRVWELDVPLTCPQGGGRRIVSLKGSVRLKVPVKVQTLEIADVLNAAESPRTIAGRRLTFHSAHKVKGGYEVKVTLMRGSLDDAEWQQWATPRDFVRLADSNGLPILFTGVSDAQGNDQQTTLTMQFENPNNAPNGIGGPVGPPAKLLWDVPTDTKEMRIPFEFKDLALP
jgi:hypothetical protein